MNTQALDPMPKEVLVTISAYGHEDVAFLITREELEDNLAAEMFNVRLREGVAKLKERERK